MSAHDLLNDPWNAHSQLHHDVRATTEVEPVNLAGPIRFWRTAGELAAPIPWLSEGSLPMLGQRAENTPDTWLGLALLKRAMGGGPPVHAASFEGNLKVSPKSLIAALEKALQVRPLRYGHGDRPRVLLGNDETMVGFNVYEAGTTAEITAVTVHEDVIKKLSTLASGCLKGDDPKKGYIYALAKSAMGGYSLTRVGSAGSPIERDNYEPNVLAAYDHVVQDLKTENPCGRLVIMAGAPGTGKTFLLRSLLQDIPKAAFVVVPPHMVKDLGSPELLPALTASRHDGFDGPMVMIIEDADKVLVERQAGDMSAISSLLNLGDGILGSALDVRILATTNAAKLEMDPATRRPGRLCSYSEVNTLNPARAQAVLQRLTKKNLTALQPMTLAEIYKEARGHGWTPPPKEKPAQPYRNDIL